MYLAIVENPIFNTRQKCSHCFILATFLFPLKSLRSEKANGEYETVPDMTTSMGDQRRGLL